MEQFFRDLKGQEGSYMRLQILLIVNILLLPSCRSREESVLQQHSLKNYSDTNQANIKKRKKTDGNLLAFSSIPKIIKRIAAKQKHLSCLEQTILQNFQGPKAELGYLEFSYPTGRFPVVCPARQKVPIFFPSLTENNLQHIQYPLVEVDEVSETPIFVFWPMTYYQVLKIMLNYQELIIIETIDNEIENCPISSQRNKAMLDFAWGFEKMLVSKYAPSQTRLTTNRTSQEKLQGEEKNDTETDHLSNYLTTWSKIFSIAEQCFQEGSH